MKHEMSKERLSDEELSQIVFYAGEAMCHPDPNYSLAFEALSHPANVLALANEVIAARALLAAHEQEPVAYSLIFRNMDGVLNSGINTNTTFATREKAEAYGKGGKYETQPDGSLKWVADENLDPVVVPLYAHPAPSIHIDENSDLIKHIHKCSEEVNKWPEWKRTAADAMSAIASPSVSAVPEGYVLVPLKPTKDMLTAAEYDRGADWQYAVDIWDSMCRAAMINGGKSTRDELRSSLQELVKAMRDYEMDVDEPAPYKHREMMRRAEVLLNGGKS